MISLFVSGVSRQTSTSGLFEPLKKDFQSQISLSPIGGSDGSSEVDKLGGLSTDDSPSGGDRGSVTSVQETPDREELLQSVEIENQSESSDRDHMTPAEANHLPHFGSPAEPGVTQCVDTSRPASQEIGTVFTATASQQTGSISTAAVSQDMDTISTAVVSQDQEDTNAE